MESAHLAASSFDCAEGDKPMVEMTNSTSKRFHNYPTHSTKQSKIFIYRKTEKDKRYTNGFNVNAVCDFFVWIQVFYLYIKFGSFPLCDAEKGVKIPSTMHELLLENFATAVKYNIHVSSVHKIWILLHFHYVQQATDLVFQEQESWKLNGI